MAVAARHVNHLSYNHSLVSFSEYTSAQNTVPYPAQFRRMACSRTSDGMFLLLLQ